MNNNLQWYDCSFIKSLQQEWMFYKDLTKSIRQHFIPNVFGQEISETEHELFDLPTTGLGGPILKIQVRPPEHCWIRQDYVLKYWPIQ